MKLAAFTVSTPLGPTRRVGAITASGDLVDLTTATTARLIDEGVDASVAPSIAEAIVPRTMVPFIAAGHVSIGAAHASLEWVAASAPDRLSAVPGTVHDTDEIIWRPAVEDPPVLRDFMAFEAHLTAIYPRLGREIPDVWYELPVYYKGNPGSTGAHNAPVYIPAYADSLDFEFEFAAVLGRGGRDIAVDDAGDHIFGYTIYNDFSAREMQSREMSVGLGPAKGKDFDGAHVLGPWIVTADEIADVYALEMTARVNGLHWSEGSTADMRWSFSDMIAHASRSEALRPGEVFGSGTAGGGCGAESGTSFHAGDVVELTIDQLGTLRNEIR